MIVPPLPGHYSAFGMLVTDVRHDYVRTCYGRLDEVAAGHADRDDRGDDLREGGSCWPARACPGDAVAVEPFFDLRYAGQEFTLRVPVGADEVTEAGLGAVRARFDEHA